MALTLHLLGSNRSTAVAVVGLGLVGRPISQRLSLLCCNKTAPSPQTVDWSLPESIVQPILKFLTHNSIAKLSVVWAAGKAGFSADKRELEDEENFFYQCIAQLSEKLANDLTVSFISSAGGIYEHSGFVEHVEDISPVRPYALAKLRQERFLHDNAIVSRIYRASTVYGFGGNRQGLITNMVRSSKYRIPMTIFADLNTIRDYLYNDDLAKKIVDDILGDTKSGIQIAASGRGLSVATLIGMIEQITNRTVLAGFRLDKNNEASIYFSPGVVQPCFARTSIEEGLRLMQKIT